MTPRVLFLVRLYSGFRSSVESGAWAPTGVPTIYKLLETISAAGPGSELVLLDNPWGPVAGQQHSKNLVLDGLDMTVTVLGARSKWSARAGRLGRTIVLLRQMIRIWGIVRRHRPELIYVDRGNLWIAAMFARISAIPVVYRVMGISPGLRQVASGSHPGKIGRRFLLRSPFAMVICTEDGSGGDYWLGQLLDSRVPRAFLMNGVDWDAGPSRVVPHVLKVPDGKTVVLYVGRLEEMKGCRDFLESFLLARDTVPHALHAVILGDGVQRVQMHTRVKDAGAEDDVTFIEALPHAQMASAYKQADIYVSLNRMGSLSNTTLEAMVFGCCIILPDPRPQIHADMSTHTLLPPETALRVNRIDDVRAIADAILRLHNRGEERSARIRATLLAARNFVKTWDERMSEEMEMLEDIVRARPVQPVCG